MPVHNAEIADLFERFAAMLDDGEDLSELPAIGEDLAGKVNHYRLAPVASSLCCSRY